MKEPNPAWKIPKLWICCKFTGLAGESGKEVSSASVGWGVGEGSYEEADLDRSTAVAASHTGGI